MAAARILRNLTGLKFKATHLLGLKSGYRPGVSVEVLEKKGFSLDVGTTTKDLYLGVSKDLLKSAIEMDVGVYMSAKYKDLIKRRKLNPELNVGVSIIF